VANNRRNAGIKIQWRVSTIGWWIEKDAKERDSWRFIHRHKQVWQQGHGGGMAQRITAAPEGKTVISF
jgi:hypothetical protein